MFSFILVLIEKRKGLLIHIKLWGNFCLFTFFFFFLSGNTFHSQRTHSSDTVYPGIICFLSFSFSLLYADQTIPPPSCLSPLQHFIPYMLQYFILLVCKHYSDIWYYIFRCLIRMLNSCTYFQVIFEGSALVLHFQWNRVSVIMSRHHTENVPGKINQVQLFQEVSTQIIMVKLWIPAFKMLQYSNHLLVALGNIKHHYE